MATIRHICAGHEYRYETDTGAVKNNYGTHVANLLICKLTGYALLYRVTPHWPAIWATDSPIAAAPGGHKATDAALAEFAIGHTALFIPEPR